MKNIIGFFSLLIVGFFVFEADATTPIKALVPIEDVFTPKGFDNNDDVEIVVSGFLPNLCYKSPFSDVKVKGKTIDIKVGALNYDALTTYCLEMIVPFVHVINVGLLERGDYNVIVNGKSVFQKKGVINVGDAATEKIDDFTYASVENIIKTQESRKVVLTGYNPSACFELDEIKVISNGVNAYSVLPVMKQVSDFCPMKMIPFNYEFTVPDAIQKAKVLLHVRAMDGKSINSIFNQNL